MGHEKQVVGSDSFPKRHDRTLDARSPIEISADPLCWLALVEAGSHACGFASNHDVPSSLSRLFRRLRRPQTACMDYDTRAELSQGCARPCTSTGGMLRRNMTTCAPRRDLLIATPITSGQQTQRQLGAASRSAYKDARCAWTSPRHLDGGKVDRHGGMFITSC